MRHFPQQGSTAPARERLTVWGAEFYQIIRFNLI